MKLVKAILRHEQLEGVRDSLDKLGITGITISDVKGSGQQRGYTEAYRGAKAIIHFRPKVKIETVIQDDQLDDVVQAILSNARTGEIGDGKIFVIPVEETIRIRTGEMGSDAV
ncbi:MAG: P-II family nitrogen regulator [Candidatus Aquicultor sp.]